MSRAGNFARPNAVTPSPALKQAKKECDVSAGGLCYVELTRNFRCIGVLLDPEPKVRFSDLRRLAL